MDDEWQGTPDEMLDHFAINAAILDAIGCDDGIDYAVSALAAWLSNARARLSTEELTLLLKVGGVLYRIGDIDTD
jgi:hypothetical protein